MEVMMMIQEQSEMKLILDDITVRPGVEREFRAW